MEKFKILPELPKYDTETQSEQALLKKRIPTDLARCRTTRDLQSVKNTINCEAQ